MMGASGMRTLIFEINEPTATLGLGSARSWEVDESEWKASDGVRGTLNSRLFSQTVKFSPLSDAVLDIDQ